MRRFALLLALVTFSPAAHALTMKEFHEFAGLKGKLYTRPESRGGSRIDLDDLYNSRVIFYGCASDDDVCNGLDLVSDFRVNHIFDTAPLGEIDRNLTFYKDTLRKSGYLVMTQSWDLVPQDGKADVDMMLKEWKDSNRKLQAACDRANETR